MSNNNIISYIMAALDITVLPASYTKRIEAANNFQRIYRNLDAREHTVKNTIFRYIQRIALNEPYDSISNDTVKAIQYATTYMYRAKSADDYKATLKYLQETYPVE